MKKLLYIFLFLNNLFAGIGFNTPSPPAAFIPNGMWEDLDLTSMQKFIKINFASINFCKVKNAKDGLVGLKAHLIEPYLVAEAVKKPYYLRMMEMDLSSQSATILQKQGKLSQGGSKYVHIMRFPILSLLMKSAGQPNMNGVFFLAAPYVTVYYMSELDPTSWKDFLKIKMLPEILYSITPQGLVAGIVDCITATTMNINFATTNKYLQDTRDLFFYANGCNGILSIGSTNDAQETPFVTAMNMIQSNIYEFSRLGLYKQSVESMLNKNKNAIWCSPQKGIKIKYQWLFQLVRPLKSKILHSGTTSALFQDMKNNGSTAGDAVFVIWKQRDYTTFAYTTGD